MKQENLIKNGIVIIDESLDVSTLKEYITEHHTRIIGMVEFKGNIFED